MMVTYDPNYDTDYDPDCAETSMLMCDPSYDTDYDPDCAEALMAMYDPNYDIDYDPDCAETTCSLVTLCKRIAVGHNVDECFDMSKVSTLDGFKVDYETALAIAKKFIGEVPWQIWKK